MRSAVVVGPRSGSEAPKANVDCEAALSLDRGAAAKLRRLMWIAKPPLSLDRGASAPLRRVVFLFVVNFPPSETISPFANTCSVGDGLARPATDCEAVVSRKFFRILEIKNNYLALLSRGYVWREPHSANHPVRLRQRRKRTPLHGGEIASQSA